MRRIFQLGTLLLLLAVFLTPVFEYFDRWDAPGLGNDTEMAVFALILILCLLLVVCKLISGFAKRLRLVLVGMVWPERSSTLHEDEGFAFKLIVPPICTPLRI